MKQPWGLLLAALLISACKEPGPDRRAGVRTLTDLLSAVGTNEDFDGLKAEDFVTPRGETIALRSPPYTASTTLQTSTFDGINVLPAFSEGATAAYLVAEVWRDLPEVWAQPWWIPVTGWNPANPTSLRVTGSKAVIPVGTESFFYSPFWQIIYAEVPADATADQYHRSSEIVSRPLHPAGPIFAPLAPPTFGEVTPDGITSIRPFTGEAVGRERKADLWLNNEDLPYLTFTSSFSWDDELVIAEQPLFMFTKADGVTPAPEIPAVIGTGPLGSGTKPLVNLAGTPLFGSLTRLYTVRVPSTASIFIPSAFASVRPAFVASGGVAVKAVDSVVDALPGAASYAFRIATDPDCFAATPATAATAAAKRAAFPTSCGFLDSQAAVEAFLSAAALTKHNLLFTSPVVLYAGKPVGRTTP